MADSETHQFEKTCFEVLKAIGKSISQISLYNRPEHPFVQAILQETQQKLTSLLGPQTPSLVFIVMGDHVLVNGTIVGPASQVPPNVASFLQRHKIHSLSFKSGLTAADLSVLCAAAAARAGSGVKSPVEALVEKGVRTVVLNEAEISVLMKDQKVAAKSQTAGDGTGAKESSGAAPQPTVNEQFVRAQFGRYMAPELVEKLAACPQDLTLGGETRAVTVMFADVRGFTTLAEGLSAQEVTRFINSFLTPMTRIILAHEGFIDKYMGDCIMAFWNAPLRDPKHAPRAAAAALAMSARLRELNQIWLLEAQQRGKEFRPVRMGIGINTGECCVGNIGSEQRFEYSAIGDSVNLASRLEGQSKVYGVDIVIGAETRRQLPEPAALELDVLRVKGKQQPERIYGLLGDTIIATSAPFLRLAGLHESFLRAYRARNWDEAERMLGACLATGFELQTFCELYRERIAVYRRHPPAPDWDGAFTALSK